MNSEPPRAYRHVTTASSIGGPRSLPRALLRVLVVFDALAKSRNGLTFTELMTVLGSPKSSLARLLRPLVKDGYLSHDKGQYRLGPAIVRFASHIASVWDFSKVTRPYLEELAQRSRESVYIGVLDRSGKAIIYVDSLDGPQVVRSSVPVGTVRPLYCTAAGRVLLAFADPEFQEEYLQTAKLEARTARTLVTRKALRLELQKICKSRVSVSVGELFPESAAVSAPIFGIQGRVVAAIAVGGPTSRLLAKVEDLKLIIAEIATRASGIPGCNGFSQKAARESIVTVARAGGVAAPTSRFSC